MELGYDDVLEILELLEHSTVDYLEIDVHGMKLVASKSGVSLQSAGPPSTEAKQAAVNAPPPPEQGVAGAPPLAPPRPVATAEVEAGLVTVSAPVVGVFYRRPAPGAAPYVELGSTVDEGDTLGLLEVMKMFTGVTAPARGEVVAILAEDGGFVEFEQPLLRIRPE